MDLWQRQNMRTAWGKSRAKEGKGKLRGVNLPGVIRAIARGNGNSVELVERKARTGLPSRPRYFLPQKEADLLLRQDWKGAATLVAGGQPAAEVGRREGGRLQQDWHRKLP